MKRNLLLALVLFVAAGYCVAGEKFEFKDGERVALIGGTFIDVEQDESYIETLLTLHHQDKNVIFRNLGWSGDESYRQTRPPAHPKLPFYLEKYKPTYFVISYGMMESMKGEAGLANFLDGCNKMIDTLLASNKDAKLMIVTPFKHEDLGKPYPDPAEHNKNLKLYVDALAKLAETRKAVFVNLYDGLGDAKGLTVNGVHLSTKGYLQAAFAFEKALGLEPKGWRTELESKGSNRVQQLREHIKEKNKQYFYRYKPQNYEYVYGSRKNNQAGLDTELDEFDKILEQRDALIAKAKLLKDEVPLPEKKFNKPLAAGDPNYKDPMDELKALTVDPGYELTLFAANPMIGKPFQMAFDPQGRLWVASTTLYPHIKPGMDANDQILILEDSNDDGKADKVTVYMDGLHMPDGFVQGDGGCYIFDNTRLIFVKDTDGDGKADSREVLLSGFGMEDSHHSCHSMRWDHCGFLQFQQGVFLHSTIETAYGIVRKMRGDDIWSTACIYEYRPESGHLGVHLWNSRPPNPWGRYFNYWGHGLYNDSSGNDGVNLILPTAGDTSHHINVPGGAGKLAGGDFISGRAMPDDIQGNLIINLFKENKTLRFAFSDDGSGYAAKAMPPLITSTGKAFRPVEVRMGPEGAFYIADWYNPLIGHMQHHLHDPGRDKNQGRIWRVTAKGKQLLPKPKLVGVPIKDVLDGLKSPEDYTRYQARRECDNRGAKEVLAALPDWLKSLDANDKAYDHHRTEALWVYASLNVVEPELLKSLLTAKDADARAAATIVLRRWIDQIPDAQDLLAKLAADESARVRLWAVVALSYIKNDKSKELIMSVMDKPTDRYIDSAVQASLKALGVTPPKKPAPPKKK
ncbi:MAG TPA: PVC-type heme-binding CxxCH protein [Planctomycetota bacterium]|nr:PVC-type heme-binding CxxCH protein [Planctomycetota bacterium]